MKAAEPHTQPARMSLHPLMYLVMLCTTTSAPRLAGVMDRGVNVLSTTSCRPWWWANEASAGRLATLRVGLDTTSV